MLTQTHVRNGSHVKNELMTVPFLRSLIFEVKSTGSELTFVCVLRLWKTLDVFGRLQTSSEDCGLFRESSEMIVLSSKILALPG